MATASSPGGTAAEPCTQLAVLGASSSSVSFTPRSDIITKGVITYGSDCSGMGTDSIALRRAALPGQTLKNEFASETSAVARRVIRHGRNPPAFLYRDLRSAGRQQAGSVDVYTAGPPYQSYSSAGKNKGMADKRCLMTRIARYIRDKQPKLFVIETVKDILTKRHKASWAKMLGDKRAIRLNVGSPAYDIKFKVLKSKHFGLAQNRERVYVVGCHRTVAHCKFEWPAPRITPALASFLDAHPREVEKELPASQQWNVEAVVKQAEAVGLDPSSVDIVLDLSTSSSRITRRGRRVHKHPHMMHDMCPTICWNRASARSYWLMSAGRRLTILELLRLQGFL